MSIRIIRTAIAIVALVIVGAAFAQAEPSNVQITFKFIAGAEILGAGSYTVDVAANGGVVLTPEKGGTVELGQIKSLGRKKVSKLELVFEEVGSQSTEHATRAGPGPGPRAMPGMRAATTTPPRRPR